MTVAEEMVWFIIFCGLWFLKKPILLGQLSVRTEPTFGFGHFERKMGHLQLQYKDDHSILCVTCMKDNG